MPVGDDLEPIVLEPANRRTRVPRARPRLGRRGRRLVTLAAIAIGVVMAVGQFTGAGPAGNLKTADPGVPVKAATEDARGIDGFIAPPPPEVPELGTDWRLIRRSPLERLGGVVSAWTGTELLVWGEDQHDGEAAGAAYDPRTDRWRTLPPAPQKARYDAASLWTDRELIVWGGVTTLGEAVPGGVAYDPASDTWRVLPPAPLSDRGGAQGVWTGTEMLVWGGYPIDGATVGLADGAAYNPATNRWRTLSRAPIGRLAANTVWTGIEMVVWGGLTGHTPVPATDGAAYDPATNHWRRLGPSPLTGRWGPTVAWTGTEVLFVGGMNDESILTDGAAYDPAADRWRILASPPAWPLRHPYGFGSGAWTGRELALQRDDDFVAYDPAADRWRKLPDPGLDWSVQAAAWTGSELILWGGESDPSGSGIGGAAWHP